VSPEHTLRALPRGAWTRPARTRLGWMSVAGAILLIGAIAGEVTRGDTTSSSDDTTDSTTTSSSSDSSSSTTASGAIARLPSAEELYGTSATDDTETRSFADRLVDALAQAFFEVLTSTFESSDFQTLLETQVESLFLPTSDTTTTTASSTL